MTSTIGPAIIAVIGTLGAATLTLGVQVWREHASRRREDRLRFLDEQLGAAAEVMAACDTIIRKINADKRLDQFSAELRDEVTRFQVAYFRLHLLGTRKVMQAANKLRDLWESDPRERDNGISMGRLEENCRMLRTAIRASLAIARPGESDRRTHHHPAAAPDEARNARETLA